MSTEILEHGAIVNGIYICNGCLVRPPHEHRCYRDHCECELCREPTCEELAALMEEIGLP